MLSVHKSFTAAIALLALLAACSSGRAAPDAPSSAWSLGPTMPRRALSPGVALLGQQVVVAGGFDVDASGAISVTTRIFAFDTTVSTWGRVPDAPVAWTDPNLAVIGATLYLAGGIDGTTAHAESYQLDPQGGEWKAIAAMDPADARGAAAVVSAPGHVFLFGGASSTGVLASCLDYDIIANTWSHLPDLPVARAHAAAMRLIDGTVIVSGGFASLDASQPLGDVWALSPPGAMPRTWQPRAAMTQASDPDARGGCSYGVVLSALVCAGGQDGQAVQNAVQSYDPYTNVWTTREAMPVDRTGTQAAAAGDRLFVPGGAATAALTPTDTLYIYAPLDTPQ